jgi:hypothetical protein
MQKNNNYLNNILFLSIFLFQSAPLCAMYNDEASRAKDIILGGTIGYLATTFINILNQPSNYCDSAHDILGSPLQGVGVVAGSLIGWAIHSYNSPVNKMKRFKKELKTAYQELLDLTTKSRNTLWLKEFQQSLMINPFAATQFFNTLLVKQQNLLKARECFLIIKQYNTTDFDYLVEVDNTLLIINESLDLLLELSVLLPIKQATINDNKNEPSKELSNAQEIIVPEMAHSSPEVNNKKEICS